MSDEIAGNEEQFIREVAYAYERAMQDFCTKIDDLCRKRGIDDATAVKLLNRNLGWDVADQYETWIEES